MKFDPALPIAVFLGPSLDAAAARQLLPANYYPPARMGDVYRLMTSGVRVIVIIDGVFHKTTPVWQREIVAALRNGITVIGAASMGALRAVELESFGMLGLGTIVDWYRSGRIEGDDEVALQHADADFGYRALSEPLVNLRWNLERAAQAGVIDGPQCAALVDDMHALDHTARSYPALFDSPAFTLLTVPERAALRAFLGERPESLKEMDARAALRWCAERLPGATDGAWRSTPSARIIDRPDAVLLRGVPTADGTLVPLKQLLPAAASDRARTAHIVFHAARRFYLNEWAARTGVRGSPDLAAAFEAQWMNRYQVTNRQQWLIANGITASELRREFETRAVTDWLLQQGPHSFGLEGPFLEAWAADMGIDAPAHAQDSDAFRAWLVESLPPFFGFDQWSADVELLREMQLTGEIATLAQPGARRPDAGVRQQEAADAGTRAL